MNQIKNKIKVVFWDLDETLWSGTLAEAEEVKVQEQRVEIIKALNARGIISSICSKNDFEEAKGKLTALGIWDLFCFPNIAFQPKGQMIKNALTDMNLRADNALFIDDNISNLHEAEYYNPAISVMNADCCDKILENEFLAGKKDVHLSRYHQYKQLEKKALSKKMFSSNEQFLHESNIRMELIDYEDMLFDRIAELTERTNQLNFTKNRMNTEQLRELLNNDSVDTKAVHVTDNFGDYGIVGFYSLQGKRLIHFVFSCRIMNMGIEQYLYSLLGRPELDIVGETANSDFAEKEIPDWITLAESGKGTADGHMETIENILGEESRLRIFGLGACDLYHTMAYFSMPNQQFHYECNVFKGKERGVNVGTEYIRSCFEMSDSEKEYCSYHFYNYTGSLAFNTRLFAEDYDYIILSFHDDMVFKIYEKKDNRNLRVILSPERKFGDTSILNINGSVSADYKEQRLWLEENFSEGHFIEPERFYENVVWIGNHTSEHTKIILITGPELNFFRKNNPHCEEVLGQISMINKTIQRLVKDYPDKFAMADINKAVRSLNDVTDYVFHLKAQTAYHLFTEIVWAMVRNFKNNRKNMLYKVLGNRKAVIWGNGAEARNAFFNLKLGNVSPCKYVHFDYQNKKIGTMQVEDYRILEGAQSQYYVVIADEANYDEIQKLLCELNYEVRKDFIRLRPIPYQKIWNEEM